MCCSKESFWFGSIRENKETATILKGDTTTLCYQGVTYSKKFCGKRGFPNLANGRTLQFMFPKYLIEHQNVKIVKSKFKSEKND